MDFLNPYTAIDVSLIDLIRNMGLGLLLAVIWTFVVSQSTRLVVDTRQYLPVFILLIPSMILIISIIKSSIALSLGLVGALSIVRFRTPIKEPEELLYLFVAIAIGLGLGANQVLATLVGFVAISVGLMVTGVFNKGAKNMQSTFLEIAFSSNDIDVASVKTVLVGQGMDLKIKRVDTSGTGVDLLLEVANFDMAKISSVERTLKAVDEEVNIVATQNARIIT